jgi:hypothetical protein
MMGATGFSTMKSPARGPVRRSQQRGFRHAGAGLRMRKQMFELFGDMAARGSSEPRRRLN